MTRALHGFGFAAKRRTIAAPAEQISLGKQLGIGLLVLLLLASAFSVIYLKDLSRRLFIHYQTQQRAQQVLELQQNKLLLEKGVWSAQSRIQSVALQQLHMQTPSMKQIVILRD